MPGNYEPGEGSRGPRHDARTADRPHFLSPPAVDNDLDTVPTGSLLLGQEYDDRNILRRYFGCPILAPRSRTSCTASTRLTFRTMGSRCSPVRRLSLRLHRGNTSAHRTCFSTVRPTDSTAWVNVEYLQRTHCSSISSEATSYL